MKTMHKFFLLILCLVIVAGCKNNNAGNLLSGNLVNNPNTASGNANGKELPVITFAEESHDFGEINQGEKVSYSFRFKNTGKSDLIISDVRATCGCTVGEFPKEPVKPGKENFVQVTFNSQGKVGAQNKMITVISNTQPNTRELTIKALIIVPEN